MGFGIKTRIIKCLKRKCRIAKMNHFIREQCKNDKMDVEQFISEPQSSVLLIGNGPSANDIDIKKITGYDIIPACVNFFPNNSKLFKIIKPRFLFLMDPRFFTESRKNDEDRKLKEILITVDWKLTIVIPAGYDYKIDNGNIDFFHLNTHYYQDDRSEYVFKKYDENILSPGAMNVVVAALYYFVASGYKKILFCGVDMSEFKDIYVDENNRIYVESTHFYGKRKFYPDEIGVGKYNIYEYLSLYVKTFFEFTIIEDYAKWKNTEIYNLSIKSYLDNFPKLSEDSIEDILI